MSRCINPYVIVYLAAIVAANFSVAFFGQASMPVNAFLFIGIDLSLRDRLHDAWLKTGLWPRMGTLIAAGSAISYVLASAVPRIMGQQLPNDMGRIALASMLAFAAAALADALVYTVLHKRGFMVRANGSNVAGAAADSVLFPLLAFGSPLWSVVLLMFAAKTCGGFVWSLILRPRRAADAAA